MIKIGDTLRITGIKKFCHTLSGVEFSHTQYGCWMGKVEKIEDDGTMYGSWGEEAVTEDSEYTVVDFPDETVDCFINKERLNRLISKAYGDERRKLEAEWYDVVKNIVPCVGLPCTICYYTDRRAATITRIIDKKTIAVQNNVVECIDYYAGDYKVLPELRPGEDIFTKRKNGEWVMEGQSTRDGVVLMLHYQNHYIDPHY